MVLSCGLRSEFLFRFSFPALFVFSLGVPHTASAVAAFLVRQGRRFFMQVLWL
jgi:hypothetical protein